MISVMNRDTITLDPPGRKRVLSPTENLRRMSLDYVRFDTDLGPMLLAADSRGAVLLSFQAGEDPVEAGAAWRENREALAGIVDDVQAYLRGEGRLANLSIGELPGTDFQIKVWKAMRNIPFGHTRTYGELASAIGHPRAMRAVGGACGANPLPLINPCHRVVGAGGALTGFSCGIDIKRKLLRLEGALELNLD